MNILQQLIVGGVTEEQDVKRLDVVKELQNSGLLLKKDIVKLCIKLCYTFASSSPFSHISQMGFLSNTNFVENFQTLQSVL